ncbi:hypothetical protein MUO32_06650 [Shinella sp. CPCC 101442]|uniref:hypothetical protein n=1 Tax=Shinella sp. CPCC 101442 TaxID=2932265 RepID=UPI002152C530|nr:hypothetical protein [Shinella sp. CPCC 101442]MCR6498701.1 hypothetical protein [Shinella sp. CPCC 101442]
MARPVCQGLEAFRAGNGGSLPTIRDNSFEENGWPDLLHASRITPTSQSPKLEKQELNQKNNESKHETHCLQNSDCFPIT